MQHKININILYHFFLKIFEKKIRNIIKTALNHNPSTEMKTATQSGSNEIKKKKLEKKKKRRCLCKYFPDPCSNCGDFGGFEWKKKICKTCSFNGENPYPPLTFDEISEDELPKIVLTEKQAKAYDAFDPQIIVDHQNLHVRATKAIKNSKEGNNIEILRDCLQSGLNPNNEWLIINGVNDNGWVGGAWSYLHQASLNKQYVIMELLIEYGANVNSIDYDGDTPLISMVNHVQNLDLIGSIILIDAGANPNFCNFEGMTPQEIILEVIRTEIGCRPHALELAFKILTLFLKNGGNLTMISQLAQSECCMSRLYSIFLEEGADPYLISEEGHSILYYLNKSSCMCPNMLESIRLLKNATRLKFNNRIDVPNCTECSICCSGNKHHFCQTLCCKQFLHVKCLNKWLHSQSNTNKSCPFCRKTVKSVDLIRNKTVFNSVNLSKKSTERGLIFSYLYKTKIQLGH